MCSILRPYRPFLSQLSLSRPYFPRTHRLSTDLACDVENISLLGIPCGPDPLWIYHVTQGSTISSVNVKSTRIHHHASASSVVGVLHVPCGPSTWNHTKERSSYRTAVNALNKHVTFVGEDCSHCWGGPWDKAMEIKTEYKCERKPASETNKLLMNEIVRGTAGTLMKFQPPYQFWSSVRSCSFSSYLFFLSGAEYLLPLRINRQDFDPYPDTRSFPTSVHERFATKLSSEHPLGFIGRRNISICAILVEIQDIDFLPGHFVSLYLKVFHAIDHMCE
ncbi:uncharacterized protein F5891DRAFT_667972 [Suillus fuscotomentosus]|uniref:Uncharacterized protein n=1 Tax=Suillus fuscotomentosus TaxID=1912939 RepID=A0AAD4DWT5_9AGAM|nr:uncharacterized protein F5891DRAFT_667972 [Suillus fuscotomentosus]KAG1895462.1 hypothetical protein F5891DRAFT_667972 [Suillus fuscotomentosus]